METKFEEKKIFTRWFRSGFKMSEKKNDLENRHINRN